MDTRTGFAYRFAAAVCLLWSTLACSDREAEPADPGVDIGSPGGSDAAVSPDAAAMNADSGLSSSSAGPRVQTRDGMLEGSYAGTSRRFLGIPFAAPPVADLRFRPPADVEPWSGVRDATETPKACPQASELGPASGTSEDCLYLNVWAPDPLADEPVPVMVWLHGGMNTTGSAIDRVPNAEELLWDGARLMQSAPAPVVIVTANYRLGWLGFLAHPALVEEQGAAGNYGLMDQRAALEWVRDNIAAFGGDPRRVTLFGQSAGAQDALLQLFSPATRGLFQRVIAESPGSPSLLMGVNDLDQQERYATARARSAGCEGPDPVALLACLRALPADSLLLDNGPPILPGGQLYQEPAPLPQPTVDGVVLPDWPLALIERGDFAKVPIIIGTNETEGAFFHQDGSPADDAEYQAAIGRLWGADQAYGVAEHYPVADFASAHDALVQVTGDGIFVCPSRQLARALSAAGTNAYVYDFSASYVIPLSSMYGVSPGSHNAELGLVWNGVDADPDATDDDRALRELVQGSFTSFARDGVPTAANAPIWPTYRSPDFEELEISSSAATLRTDPKRDLCAFWESIYR